MKKLKILVVNFLLWLAVFPVMGLGFLDLNIGVAYEDSSGLSTTVYAVNGTEQINYNIYARKGRINFWGVENGTDILYDVIGNFNGTIINSTDMDENGNYYESYSMLNDGTDSRVMFRNNGSINYDTNTTYFESVFQIPDLSLFENWNSNDFILQYYSNLYHATYTGFSQMKFRYNQATNQFNVYLQMFLDIHNYQDTFYFSLNMSKPIFLSYRLSTQYDNDISVKIGNINDTIYEFGVSHNGPHSLDLFVHEDTYLSLNELSENLYLDCKVIDFNYGFSNLSQTLNYSLSQYDETFYSERCLEFYIMNNDSYGIEESGIISSDFTIVEENRQFRENLTDNEDYKLFESNVNKTGITQFDDINWENDTQIPLESYVIDEFEDRQNVLYLEDNSTSYQVSWYYNLSSIQDNNTFDFYIAKNETTGSSSFIFYLLENSTTIIRLRFEENDLDYYNSGWIEVDGNFMNSNEWYKITLFSFNDTGLFDLYIDGLRVGTNLVFENNATNGINRIRLLTHPSHDFICYFDSFGIESLDYTIDSNVWIGSQNYTQSMNTYRLSHENLTSTSITVDSSEYDTLFDIEYTRISQANLGNIVRRVESDYSVLGLIIGNINFTSVSFPYFNLIGLEVYNRFDESSSSFQIFFYDNGSVRFRIRYYDFYTGLPQINWVSSYYNSFYNQSGVIDNRIGIFIQRFGVDRFKVCFCNSTFMYISDYYYYRVSFAYTIDITIDNMFNFNIYGIIGRDEDTSDWWDYWSEVSLLNGVLFNRIRIYNQSVIQSYTFTEYTLSLPLYVNYAYISQIGYRTRQNSNYDESKYDYTGYFYSDSNVSLGTFNEFDGYTYIDGLRSESYDYIRDIGSTDVLNHKIYAFYNIIIYTNNLSDTFLIDTDIRIRWYFYYSQRSGGFFDRIMEILVPLFILGMFPVSLYPKFKLKGAMIGLIGGLVILYLGNLLSLRYLIVMIPISIIMALLVFKDKGVDKNN